jgi:4-amino-4-deoxy-L-arabinose transferase-like glycosyltransferase
VLGKRNSTLAAVALVVVAIAAALYLTGLSELPFYTKGEPREALVVWEMANGSSLVLPLRNGTEIPSKPPFFHWLGLISSSALGTVSELSARLPSALLAVVAVTAVYLFGATIGRIRSGWLAAVALAFSFEWIRAARIARVDMTLTFFLFAALLCFGVMNRSGVTRVRLWVFYAAIAAATLAKGPVGVALPAFVIVLYALLSPPPAPDPSGAAARERLVARARHAWETVLTLRPIHGLAAVAAVVGAWYVAAWAIGGNDFFVKHVLKENLFRVIDPEKLDTGHEHGPFYLLPHFFVGALPWSLLAPAVAWWLWRMRPLDATTRYLVVWFVAVIVFYSIPASKRSVYILPAHPAGALLLGLVLGPGPEGPGPRKLAAWGLMIAAGGLALAGVVLLLVAVGVPFEALLSSFLKPKDQQGVVAALDALRATRWTAVGAALAVLAGAAGTIRTAPGAHWLRASVTLSVALVALYAGAIATVERGVAESRTLKPFLAQVRERVGDGGLGFFCAFDYGAVFYARRHIPMLLGGDECRGASRRRAALAAPDAPPYLLLWEDEAARAAPQIDVLLTSEGRGPKGRARMVLASPNGRSPEPLPATPEAGNGDDARPAEATDPREAGED